MKNHEELANHLLEDIGEVSKEASAMEIEEWHKNPDGLVRSHIKDELAFLRERLMCIQCLLMNRPMVEEEAFTEKNGGLLRFSPLRIKSFKRSLTEPVEDYPERLIELRDQSMEIVERMVRLQRDNFDPSQYVIDMETSGSYINTTFKV